MHRRAAPFAMPAHIRQVPALQARLTASYVLLELIKLGLAQLHRALVFCAILARTKLVQVLLPRLNVLSVMLEHIRRAPGSFIACCATPAPIKLVRALQHLCNVPCAMQEPIRLVPASWDQSAVRFATQGLIRRALVLDRLSIVSNVTQVHTRQVRASQALLSVHFVMLERTRPVLESVILWVARCAIQALIRLARESQCLRNARDVMPVRIKQGLVLWHPVHAHSVILEHIRRALECTPPRNALCVTLERIRLAPELQYPSHAICVTPELIRAARGYSNQNLAPSVMQVCTRLALV